MTRIVAGTFGGRRLVVPVGRDTRPTAERVREGLFSALTARLGGLDGVSFLDLYAGSGAVGLEAASRGAAPVTVVEQRETALRAVRANLADLAPSDVTVAALEVSRFLAGPVLRAYDVVFLDPPYSTSVDADLAALVDRRWLASDAIVVVERATRDAPVDWPDGLAATVTKRYGDTTLAYATLCYGSRS